MHRGGSRIFEGGGGVQAQIQDCSQAPPPPLLDIVRVTSSALRKLKDPRSWTFTSTPLGHCPRDVIHRIRHCILGLQAKKGGGSNFGPNVKKPTSWPKGGGGSFPGGNAWNYVHLLIPVGFFHVFMLSTDASYASVQLLAVAYVKIVKKLIENGT